MSAKPDGDVDGVQVLLVGAQRLDPGDRGGEMAAPGVDQQSLERLVDPVDQQLARPPGGCPARRRRPRSPRSGGPGCRPPSRPAGPSSGRPPRVRLTTVSKSSAPLATTSWHRGERVGVGPGEGDLAGVLGEARAPATAGAPAPGLTPASSATWTRVERGRPRRGSPRSRALTAGAGSGSVIGLRRRRLVGVLPCSSWLSVRWVSSTCGMSCSITRPWVLASLMISVPQPSIRSMMPIS